MRRFLPRLAPVLDLTPRSASAQGPRALLAYKTASFHLVSDDPRLADFSHEGLGPAMVTALHGLGYTVDVVDYQHPDPSLSRLYDLFIGHMNINFTRIARQLPPSSPRLYLASTMPWRLNNRLERDRLRALRRRRGVWLPEERLLYFDEDPAYRMADGIICLGNEVSRAAFAPHPSIHPIRNAARLEARAVPSTKDFSEARRHFLFYAGPGSVHKGLDLLLECFPALANAGLHLHVCQHLTEPFARLYARELRHTPNIHLHGNIVPRSPEYYSIVDRCAYLVSPSCAEGGQGAVVESLHQGLVPLLSRECTVDVTPAGFLLPDCAIATLAKSLQTAATLPPAELKQRALATQAEAQRRYSETAFIASFQSAVEKCVEMGRAR